MKAEFELLVRACGLARNLPVYGAKTQGRLPDGFDEALFVRIATQHKTADAAYKGLKKLGLGLSPENSLRLKRNAMQYKLVRQLIFEGGCEIIEAARRHGIPALVIKGPASSLQLYSDPTLREFNDLDILVNLPDVSPAIPFMGELGFVAKDYKATTTTTDPALSKMMQRSHHVTFWKEGCPFRVEMHDRTGWEHEMFRRDDIDAVFQRAAIVEHSGISMLAPDLPDHAALIIAHGVGHAWCLLHWILDVSVLFAREDDPLHRAIAARIRELGMQRHLKLTCDMIRTLYAVELPSAIESVISGEPELTNALSFALDRLQVGGSDISALKIMIAFRTVYLPVFFNRPRDKIVSFINLLKIPQMDKEAVPLPRQLFFLHFFLRPFFIIARRLRKNEKKQAKLHV